VGPREHQQVRQVAARQQQRRRVGEEDTTVQQAFLACAPPAGGTDQHRREERHRRVEVEDNGHAGDQAHGHDVQHRLPARKAVEKSPRGLERPVFVGDGPDEEQAGDEDERRPRP
jgi:hypothetical protein